MFFRKNDKNNIFTIEQYSYYIIKCLSISEEDFFKSNNIQYDLFSQTLYYLYHLYICDQLLSIKYNEELTNEIILKASDFILEYQSKDLDNKKEFKNKMFNFLLYLKSEDIRINEKERIAKTSKNIFRR